MSKRVKLKRKSYKTEAVCQGKKVELVPPVSLTGSRNELMLLAKERGIKNFRVLNKSEFGLVLAEGVTPEQIEEVVSGEVSRWKAGWGSKKEPKS